MAFRGGKFFGTRKPGRVKLFYETKIGGGPRPSDRRIELPSLSRTGDKIRSSFQVNKRDLPRLPPVRPGHRWSASTDYGKTRPWSGFHVPRGKFRMAGMSKHFRRTPEYSARSVGTVGGLIRTIRRTNRRARVTEAMSLGNKILGLLRTGEAGRSSFGVRASFMRRIARRGKTHPFYGNQYVKIFHRSGRRVTAERTGRVLPFRRRG